MTDASAPATKQSSAKPDHPAGHLVQRDAASGGDLGGVRDQVARLAAALTPPVDFPGRDFILVAAVVVILVTVPVQGAMLGLVIGWGSTPHG